MEMIKLGLLIVLGLLAIDVTQAWNYSYKPKASPCDSDPCQNGGSCYASRFASNGFNCYCNSPYSGDFCDKVCNITVCDKQFQAAKNEFYNKPDAMSKKFYGGYGGYGYGDNSKYVEFCLPLAQEFIQCLAGVQERGEYCECTKYQIDSLNYPKKAKELCNAGYDYCEKNYPADNACLNLKTSIDDFLYQKKVALAKANRPKVDYDAFLKQFEYIPHRDYFNNKRSVEAKRSITRQAPAATNDVTDGNVEEKINEYAACAPSVRAALAEAIHVGCFNDGYLPNPEAEVARLRSEVDGCDHNQLSRGCNLPNYYRNPCGRADIQPAFNQFANNNNQNSGTFDYNQYGNFDFGFRKRQAGNLVEGTEAQRPYQQQVDEYYNCLGANLAQQPACQRFIDAKDAHKAALYAAIDQDCADEMAAESILAVCLAEPEQAAAPVKKAETYGEADLRAMKRILAQMAGRRQ